MQTTPNLSASLHWVQGELAQSLQRVRSLIEQRIEAPEDPAPLKLAVVELHQVRGTAAMIQCAGIAGLAEEMKRAVQDVLADPSLENEGVYAALMGSAVQLADYVDALVTGMPDSVLVFQPTISELRVARGKPPVGDAEVFADQPGLTTVPVIRPAAVAALPPGSAQAAGQKFLNVFQQNLLSWIKGQEVQLALGRIGKVAEQLATNSHLLPIHQLWRMTAALAEALLTRGLDDTPELKRLVGRAGAQLKLLAEQGEAAAAAALGNLPYQVLFHVGRSRSQGPRVAALKNAYGLARLVPSPADVEALRAKIRGPNSDLLMRLSEEIRKDLAQAKDQIDLAVRGGGKTAVDFSPTVEKLNRVGVTLSMLGLSALQDVVQGQARALGGLKLDAGAATHPAWLELATALLRVEHSLDDALSRQLRRSRSETGAAPAPESLIGGIPDIDVQEGREALMRESLVDLARLKTAADAYLLSGFREQKEEATRLLAQIEPGLQILGSMHAAGLVADLRRYMQSEDFERVRSERAHAEKFADAIAGIEFYFEGLRAQAPDTDARVDRLTGYLRRLGALPDDEPSADVAAAPETGPAIDAEPTPESEPATESVPVVADLAAGTAMAPEVPARPKPETESAMTVAAAPVVAEDEVDPEIREIFVAEASEVMEQMTANLAALKVNPGDQAALREARRGYHTLKGSGRMVGAKELGQFAWEIEKLLNQCLEGGVATSPAVIALIDEASALVPTLVENYSQRQPLDPAAAGLEERARTLAKGERAATEPDLMATFVGDARERIATVLSWVRKQDLAQTHFVLSRDVTAAFHTLRGSAALVHANGVAILAGQIEDYLLKLSKAYAPLPSGGLQLLGDVSAELDAEIQQLASGHQPSPDLVRWRERLAEVEAALSNAAPSANISAHERYALAAFDRLRQIEGDMDSWSARPTDPAPCAALQKGFDELADAATAANCDPQADVAAAVSEALQQPGAPDSRFFQSLRRVVDGLYNQLDAFREDALDPADTGLLVEAHNLHFADSPPSTEFGLASGRAPPDSMHRSDVPQSLAANFIDEAPDKDDAGIVTELALELPSAEPASPIDATIRTMEMPAVEAESGESSDALGAEGPTVQVQDEALEISLEEAALEVVPVEEALEVPPVEEYLDVSPLEEALEVPPVYDELEVSSVEDVLDVSPIEVLDVSPIDEVLDVSPVVDAIEVPAVASVPAASVVAAAGDTPADPELLGIFQAEAEELLDSMDQHIATLERTPAARDALQGLARDLHTFKGGARMSGLMSMGTAAHEMESRVEKLSDGRIQPGVSAISQLRTQWEGLQLLHDRLLRGLAPAAVPEPMRDLPPEESFEDDFSVDSDAVEFAPVEPAAPVAPKRRPEADGWNPEMFWTPDDSEDNQAVRRELARVSVERLDRMLNEAGEISIYRARIEEQFTGMTYQLVELQQTLSRVRDQLRGLDIETDAQIAARGFSQSVDEERANYSEFDPLEMDRYTRMQELSRALSESLNDLSALHSSMDEGLSETETLLMQQGRVNAEVQRGLMGTLMVPFSRQEARLQRVVKQTALDTGKRAELRFEGIEQELDRNVLERMVAPLEHLLRNAVVHGLESPQARAAAGKPETGVIQVSLRREGTQLAIDVRDDGQGLNYEAIRRTAVERGLMARSATLRESEVAMFIFEAGFSTARELTQTAGRGVGMDVVASEVKQLGGALELSSEPGKGTRFIIRLPLTLAMSQVLLVTVANEVYAIPLTTLEGIARLPRSKLGDYLRDGGPRFNYGGLDYSVRELGGLVDAPPHELPEGSRTVPAVLIRLGEGLTGTERRVAVMVDSLLGNREIVSKAVGPQVSAVQGISGGTILPDGRVVLILDVPALLTNRARRAAVVQAAQEQEQVRPVAAPVDVRQTIMVVDDSITIRRVTERLLDRNGFRVVTAKDGLDAMTQLQTESPTVILLDIEMPRADGFEVAAFVRNNPRIKDVPIIMITSRSGEKHRERARAIGVNRYVIKPYQEEQLMTELRAVMRGEDS